ncbi:GNAT family N-acetyltransferase [Rhizomonospora bruguierae]|uniref:GNAT family N-acetyltransferase n=1 Tax=Rhizomonospora bruguierae TaxID=1581705 RepID=UPI001BCB520C|nr:GNAT family N-acetyltransferase [Micromonospora sp. NBRC 107566]
MTTDQATTAQLSTDPAATDLPLRAATPDDWPGVSRLVNASFHETPDEELDRIERRTYEPERALLATDGGEVVAHAAAFTRDLTVPGQVVPAAHVTMVGVAATHRRRGLLRRMMERQLREVRDAGHEPIAVLWASEGRIYPRFGYDSAARHVTYEIDLREAAIAPAPATGTLRTAEPDAVAAELAKVYERLRPGRVGWSSRDDAWWAYNLADIAARHPGQTKRRAVLHEGPGGVDGYALWRVQRGWDHLGPCATVKVDLVAAADPGAYRDLWGFLFGIDLARRVDYAYAAPDEPLQYLVNEPNRLGARLNDSLWIRVVDVPAALAARRYATPVDVVLDVADPLLPANARRWRLSAGPDGAACDPTDAPADLALSVNDLGAAYLGATPLAGLAGAGRVRELRPGALAAATAAFGWHTAPQAVEVF